MNLELSRETIRELRNGEVFCEICFRHEDLYFPVRGWTDYASIILPWWADAVIALATDGTHSSDLQFMDGPYMVHLIGDRNSLVATFVDDHVGKGPVLSFDTDVSTIKSQVQKAFQTLDDNHVASRTPKHNFSEYIELLESELPGI